METYIWMQPERRDLYLAAHILARSEQHGEWLQWASDTLIEDLELHSRPQKGANFWIAGDEVELVNELGRLLWSIVEADPRDCAGLLAAPHPALSAVAGKVVERIAVNGRLLA